MEAKSAARERYEQFQTRIIDLSHRIHSNPEVGFLRRLGGFTEHLAQVRFSRRPRARMAVRKFNYDAALDYITDRDGRLLNREALISIPPKYAVAQVIGFIKGKSAIHIARTYMGVRRNFVGQNFWARGYFVSTVGRDEAAVRDYIRRQEAEDKRLEQMKLKLSLTVT